MNYDKEISQFLLAQKDRIDGFKFNNGFIVLINHFIDSFCNTDDRPVREIHAYLKNNHGEYELYEHFFEPFSDDEINNYLKQVYADEITNQGNNYETNNTRTIFR